MSLVSTVMGEGNASSDVRNVPAASPTQNAISVHKLTKIYPRSKQPAIDCISFDVKCGQVFGLLGPNGAGKSTTIRIVAGMILPTSGEVHVFGHDTTRQGRAARKQIGLAGEGERAFYYRLTGQQNLEFFGGLAGLRGRRLKESITRVLALLELEDVARLQFMKYSAGMKKRLAIARACLGEPALYILDEPTSSVDPITAIKIRELIKELAAQGKTVLLATHNLMEAEQLCDVAVIMHQGHLVAIDSPARLRALIGDRPRTITIQIAKTDQAQVPTSQVKAVDHFLESLALLPDVSKLQQQNGQVSLQIPSSSDLMPVLKELGQASLPVWDITVTDSSLEDVFVQLTADRRP